MRIAGPLLPDPEAFCWSLTWRQCGSGGRRMINCAGRSMPSRHPFSDQEFEEWMALPGSHLRPEVIRPLVASTHSKETTSRSLSIRDQSRLRRDAIRGFALRLLGRNNTPISTFEAFVTTHTRDLSRDPRTTDTADAADLKKKAYADFKDHKKLTLKDHALTPLQNSGD